MATDGEKPGILSVEQRKYLKGDSETEIGEGSKKERAIRGRIRERLQGAFYDLELINTLVEDRDRNTAFAAIERDEQRGPYTQYSAEVLGIVFKGMIDPDTDTQMFPDLERNFAEVIEASLVQALLSTEDDILGVTVDVDIERRVEGADLEALSERPERELKRMLSYDQISSEQFIEAIREKQANRSEES